MSVNRQNYVSKPFKLMLGMGLIILGFTSQAISASSDCKKCNNQPKICAIDKKFFKTCEDNCPPTTKSDPIAKCRKALKDRCEKRMKIILNLNDPIKETERDMLFGNCPPDIIDAIDQMIQKSCGQKQEIIDNAVKSGNPFKDKTIAHMLRNCPQATNGTSSPTGGSDAPASSTVPPQPQTSMD